MKTWNASALTGGATRALDAISVNSLTDGDRAISIVSGELYIHEYDASGTDSEDSPDVIRPDDFSTQGNWILATSPLDNTELYAGDVIGRFASTPSTGFLECDGSSVLRAGDYADLFDAIGVKFGSVDATHFTLPDLRGRFLRGWDHGATLDPDAATRTDRGDTTTGDNIGTLQADQLTSHLHPFGSNAMTYQPGSASKVQNSGASLTDVGTDSGTSNTGGNETRPVNINIMWMIKY